MFAKLTTLLISIFALTFELAAPAATAIISKFARFVLVAIVLPVVVLEPSFVAVKAASTTVPVPTPELVATNTWPGTTVVGQKSCPQENQPTLALQEATKSGDSIF